MFKIEEITIITKCCHPLWDIFRRVDEKFAFNDIEASLKALNIDYVDVLLLHRDDENVPIEKIIIFMNKILKKGYAKSIGVSNFSIDRLKVAKEYVLSHSMVPFQVIEPQFSLVVRNKDSWHNGSKSITGDEHLSDRIYLKENNIPALCYSSLADGYLSGKFKADSPDFRKNLTSWSRKAYDYSKNREILKRAETLAKEKNISLP